MRGRFLDITQTCQRSVNLLLVLSPPRQGPAAKSLLLLVHLPGVIVTLQLHPLLSSDTGQSWLGVIIMS